MATREDILTLVLTPGVGGVTARRLLELCPDGQFEGRRLRTLRKAGLTSEALARIKSGESRKRGRDELRSLEAAGDHLLVQGRPDYPRLLEQIADPPLALWARGRIASLYRPSVAIVGARQCSQYGREVARRFSDQLSGFGLTIVSGLARGVDRAAHEGALERGGTTIAVLGTGLDIAYPRAHAGLQQQVAESGCLLSEFPLGTTPRPGNFPARNRMISGLCLGTLIVEGTRDSGSLITAGCALEQNRELWAVPGNVTSRLSEGPNRLIQQGAQPALDGHDVLGCLPMWALSRLQEQRIEEHVGLEPSEARLLGALEVDRPTHFDVLAESFTGTVSELSAILLELQMKRLVRPMPGDCFVRAWRPESLGRR